MEANRPTKQDSASPGTGSSSGPGAASADASSSLGEAVALGWRMAELYRDATKQSTRKPKLPNALPSGSRLGRGTRTEFGIAEVEAGLRRLDLAGTDAPSTEELSDAFEDSTVDAEGVKRSVYKLHLAILRECNAADRALGKAYELGRALADTCPGQIDRKLMAQQLNRYRLDELGRWLADLASRLPDHSSRAVRISMARWKIAAKDGESSALFAQDDLGTVHRALDRQVQIWRSLLTNEKQAKDTLGTDGYAKAVGFAVRDSRRLITGYLWRFLPFVLLALALLGAGVLGLLTYKDTSKVIASAAAVVGALGISWKGIAATLGRAADEIEKPIWAASVDLVVADAITQAPASSVSLSVAANLSTAAGGTPESAHTLAARRARNALPAGSDTIARSTRPEEANESPDG
jgi:hypothetical protein